MLWCLQIERSPIFLSFFEGFGVVEGAFSREYIWWVLDASHLIEK